MGEFLHSNQLFLKQDGSPIVFCMPPCKERHKMKPYVEHGGGILTRKMSDSAIRLIPGDATVQSPGENLMASYVLHCVIANKLLKRDKYRLVMGQICPDSDSEIELENSPNGKVIIHGQARDKQGRKKYLLSEDTKIIRYLLDEQKYKQWTGVKVWKEMEQSGVTCHTWQSMKEHYRKVILPNLRKYVLKEQEFATLTGDLPSSVKTRIHGEMKNKMTVKKSPKNIFSTSTKEFSTTSESEEGGSSRGTGTYGSGSDKDLVSPRTNATAQQGDQRKSTDSSVGNLSSGPEMRTPNGDVSRRNKSQVMANNLDDFDIDLLDQASKDIQTPTKITSSRTSTPCKRKLSPNDSDSHPNKFIRIIGRLLDTEEFSSSDKDNPRQQTPVKSKNKKQSSIPEEVECGDQELPAQHVAKCLTIRISKLDQSRASLPEGNPALSANKTVEKSTPKKTLCMKNEESPSNQNLRRLRSLRKSSPLKPSSVANETSIAGTSSGNTRRKSDVPKQIRPNNSLQSFVMGENSSDEEENPYEYDPTKCPECEHVYESAGGLTVHFKVAHGQYPFECRHCTAKFIHLGAIWYHYRKTCPNNKEHEEQDSNQDQGTDEELTESQAELKQIMLSVVDWLFISPNEFLTILHKANGSVRKVIQCLLFDQKHEQPQTDSSEDQVFSQEDIQRLISLYR